MAAGVSGVSSAVSGAVSAAAGVAGISSAAQSSSVAPAGIGRPDAPRTHGADQPPLVLTAIGIQSKTSSCSAWLAERKNLEPINREDVRKHCPEITLGSKN
jgi:hypothetical protein